MVLRVINDPSLAAGLRQNGLQQVTKFSWRKMAGRTLDLYGKI
jgi:glycosyltransferase involved in cell wall biosynthesis